MKKHFRKRRCNQIKIIIFSAIGIIMLMTVGYAAFSTNLNITAIGNIIEKDRVIQSWTNTSNEDFHTDYYRENIVSATFLDNNNIPDNATEYWNVSEDKVKGGVMAWVVPTTNDSTKYDLYIGANGGVIANENSHYLFVNFYNTTTINLENFDTSTAKDMMYMFGDCSKLVDLDLSAFDTSSATSLYGLFAGCESLTSLDLSNFNTINVTNMELMFSTWSTTNRNYKTSSLTTIIFGENFDTSNVTTLYDMFQKCDKLTKLDLSGFDTSNVTNMVGMFMDTSNLKCISVGPNWTTSQADTTGMFNRSGVSKVTTGQC